MLAIVKYLHAFLLQSLLPFVQLTADGSSDLNICLCLWWIKQDALFWTDALFHHITVNIGYLSVNNHGQNFFLIWKENKTLNLTLCEILHFKVSYLHSNRPMPLAVCVKIGESKWEGQLHFSGWGNTLRGRSKRLCITYWKPLKLKAYTNGNDCLLPIMCFNNKWQWSTFVVAL